jgi:hypothetical protein
MFSQLKFVWARFVCAIRHHTFTQDGHGIVYCERCNWYGGPAGSWNAPLEKK